MSQNYNVRQARGVTVIDVSGRIALGDAASSGMTLHALIRDLLNQGQKNLLLNLRDLTYLDSSGIGELFGCFTTVQSQGGVLKLSNPSERVRNLLQLTKLNTVMSVIDDESTAIQSFSKSGAA